MSQTLLAVRFLRNQHKKTTGLFQQLSAITARSNEMAGNVQRELLLELQVDTEVKRNIFYPGVRKLLSKSKNEMSLETVIRNLDEIYSQLETISQQTNPEQFQSIEDLMVRYQDCFETEERTVYPIVQEMNLPKESDIHSQIERERDRVYSLPEFQDALPSKVQNPNGGEQMRKAG